MSIFRSVFNLGKNNYNRKFITNRFYLSTIRAKTDVVTAENNEDSDDKPIKYSTSKALNWTAKASIHGEPNDRLWYEPYVVLASLTIFLLYFTIFREENDIDQELSKTLYNRIDGLEEAQLKISLEYNRTYGLPTDELVQRLKRIENEK